MKIIISRKGFDSGYGGVASPIMSDGSMTSISIPGMSFTSYRDIELSFANMEQLVTDLTKGKITGRTPTHFDPDLNPYCLERKEGWLPSLGQCGSAQSHLVGQKVDVGDIFLFFGWFREVENKENKFQFKSKSPDLHVMFGYLQVGEILALGAKPNIKEILDKYPWLDGHAHLYGTRQDNNTIYIGSQNLVIDGLNTGLPGGGSFNQYHEALCLTATHQKTRSLWKVPTWLKSGINGDMLSYHKDSNRWKKDEEGNIFLQSVAKGQEFVIEINDMNELIEWFKLIGLM